MKPVDRCYQPELETLPRGALQQLQSERLSGQVARVWANVPHYRRLMERQGVTPGDIHGIDDLCKLPFTCKSDLQDTYPYGMFAVPMAEVVRLHASSGTTGKQIVAGYTRQDLSIWDQLIARQLTAVGADETDIIHISYGYGLFTGGLGLHGGSQLLGATTVPVSAGNTQRQITIFKDFGSTILCCTPSYAAYLGEALRESGLTPADIRLKAGIFGAEAWTEEMRKDIERTLGLKAYDVYGLTEVMGPGVAYECSAQSGMHVNEDHFLVEVVDPDTGRVLSEGEQGELVFTCLTKQAFPLLRYRTRDIGMITRDPCPCGRSFVRMSKPRGRVDDMLIIRGVNVFPSQIEALLLAKGYPPQYQIVADRMSSTDTLEVQVELPAERGSCSEWERLGRQQELAAALKSSLGISAGVCLVSPKTLARSEGKTARVIDRRKLY